MRRVGSAIGYTRTHPLAPATELATPTLATVNVLVVYRVANCIIIYSIVQYFGAGLLYIAAEIYSNQEYYFFNTE